MGESVQNKTSDISFFANANRVTNAGGVAYGYDANDNLLNEQILISTKMGVSHNSQLPNFAP